MFKVDCDKVSDIYCNPKRATKYNAKRDGINGSGRAEYGGSHL
jgi:hypothetical protein